MAAASEESFLRRHLGTDLLLGSWLFLISTILFAVVTAIQLAKVTNVNDDDDYYVDSTANVFLYSLLLVVSIVFTYGSYIFVVLAYPENIDKMVTTLMTMDLTTLSMWEKYFTATDFLWMSWMFAFAFCLLFIYPIWGLATGAVSVADSIVFIAVLVICLFVFVVFIASCLPENMLANQGQGSSIVFDLLCGCCGSKKEGAFLYTHFGTDFLCAMWGIMFFALCSIIASIYSLSLKPNDSVDITQFIACVLFLAGSVLMLLASYPNQMKSDKCWRFLTGDNTEQRGTENKDDRVPDESSRLLV
jgi:hypothetical protein